ncbi:MAG: isochorismatase family cysteine hydrolase [Candidatus Sulfotelmatobacter sp.]
MRPVLIVIDMLHDFLESWEPDRKEGLVHSINELVSVMRSLGHPVIWVRQEFEPDLRDAFPEMRAKGIRITIKGTKGCEIISELDPVPSDTIMVKKRYSAFYGTTLDEILVRLAPDALILAGINTHACIRTTAICLNPSRDQYPCLYSHDSYRRIPARLACDPGYRLHRFLRPGTSRNLAAIYEGQNCRGYEQ